MKVTMTGASGYVGTRLTKEFRQRLWQTVPVVRDDLGSDATLARLVDGADALVNLAGAPILARWTSAYKQTLRQSRIDTTRALVRAIGAATVKPRVLVSASAVGIYRTGGMTHTEDSHELDEGFLGQLARDWEAEAMRASEMGVRVVILRFGIVLSCHGGALARMLPPFRLGLGGRIGSGGQYFSWVHLDDLAAMVARAITFERMSGAYNATAPNPVTNAELTRALGAALGRPTFMRVPPFVLRLQYGEGARVLVEGQKVLPERLTAEGFRFGYERIGQALAACVKEQSG
jgi:hypothetical protein